jgi:hypothetical protein
MSSSDKSKNIKNIKGARSLNELLSIIDLIEGNVQDLDKRTDKILSSLSKKTNSITISISSGTEREAGDLNLEISDKSLKNKKGPGKKVKNKNPNTYRTVLDKSFKTPNTKDLVKNSAAIQELNDNISELEVSLRVLQSKDFAKLDENSGATVHIKTVLLKAKDLRDKQLKAMSRISKDYTPSQHTKILTLARKTLITELDEENYSSLRVKTYILTPSTDIIYFQSFIVVNDLSNEDGYVYENYSYVLTSVFQSKDGELRHHLTTLKDPKTPGGFPIGKEIENPSSLKMKLRMLNILDSLIFKKNKIALRKTTEQLKNNNLTKVSKYIKNIRVKGTNLFVAVEESLTKTQKVELVNKLFPVIRTIFLPRTSRNTHLAYKEITSSKTGKPFLVFSLGRTENTKTKDFVDKMSRLVEVLGLNPQIQRSVLQKIVEEYER